MKQPLEHYEREFANTRARRSQSEPAELARTREDALRRFLTLGFPTTRDEEWRFTSVAPIAEQTFALADTTPDASHCAAAPLRLPGVFSVELVFVDGRYAPALSTIAA